MDLCLERAGTEHAISVSCKTVLEFARNVEIYNFGLLLWPDKKRFEKKSPVFRPTSFSKFPKKFVRRFQRPVWIHWGCFASPDAMSMGHVDHTSKRAVVLESITVNRRCINVRCKVNSRLLLCTPLCWCRLKSRLLC